MERAQPAARERLAGSDEWDEFDSKVAARPMPDGLGNEDVFCTDYGGGFVGMSFRFFDPETELWSIYWADSRRPGLLDPPVIGSFSGDIGVFEGEDTFDGRPILVRFTWSGVTTPTPRWEQAFSDDDGETWETNWIMDFTRARGAVVSALEQSSRAASRPSTGTSRRSHAASRASCSAERSSSGTTSRRTTRRCRSRSARSPGATCATRRQGRRRSASRRPRVRDPPPLRRATSTSSSSPRGATRTSSGRRSGRRAATRTSLPALAGGGAHRPTFCVWELGAVCHERDAWSRVPRSARDEAARRRNARLVRGSRVMASEREGQGALPRPGRARWPLGLVEGHARAGAMAEHAQFMNSLVDDGLILFGGPVEGGARRSTSWTRRPRTSCAHDSQRIPGPGTGC